MHPRRNEVITLRKSGLSYKEITAQTGVGKGTINYIVKGIKLTEAQHQRLRDKQVAAGKHTGLAVNNDKTMKSRLSASVAAAWRNAPKAVRKRWAATAKMNGTKALKIANLVYRDDELPTLRKLNVLFDCHFMKALIAGYYFDFVSDKLLIEHTIDPTHGAHDVVKRFEAVINDPRRKIAYLELQGRIGKRGNGTWLKRVGQQTLARLKALGVEVFDYRALA